MRESGVRGKGNPEDQLLTLIQGQLDGTSILDDGEEGPGGLFSTLDPGGETSLVRVGEGFGKVLCLILSVRCPWQGVVGGSLTEGVR
jgi:hypothetical protein